MIELPDKSNLPSELLELPRFILWFEERRGDKITKVPTAPWQTEHWGAASAKDPANFTDYDTAVKYAQQRGGYGIGFAFDGDGIIGIDLDGCIGDEGIVNEFASRVIVKSNSYTELSPSGKGIHIICRGNISHAIRKKEEGIEIYDKDRFFTLTGQKLKDTPFTINECQEVLNGLWAQFGEEISSRERKKVEGEIPIDKVVPMGGLKKRGSQSQGSHPVHGSSTGMNFSVNMEKNVWFCYRHWTGGGPLEWLAVQEGIIECKDVVPGVLKGKTFGQVLKIAKERGLIKEAGDERGPLKYFEVDEKTGKVKGFIPMYLGEDIKKDFRFATMKDNEEIYFYQEGVYLRGGEVLVKKEARRRLSALAHEHYVNEAVAHIKETTYVDRKEFDNPYNLVAVENGLLNVLTGELLPHTPERLIIAKIPVLYDKDADCPKIRKFLSEIHQKADIRTSQEMVGYCLLRRYPFAVAFMLLGSGSNGKSTELNLIEALLGEENIATPSLHDLLGNRFSKAELFQKLANIHSDIPSAKLEYTGTFKMLTGQDTLYMERKNMDPFYAKNYAKLIYSANELPKTEDLTLAFFRRWILFKFPNVFPENDPKTDPHILEKLTTPKELSGFLNWALKGLHRLLKQGHFTRTRPMEAVENEWIMETDSLRAFVNERVRVRREEFTTKADFYEKYKEFCVEHEIEAVTMSAVGHRLPSIIPQTGEIHPRVGKKQQKAWKDILITDITDNLTTPNARKKNIDTYIDMDTGVNQKKRNIGNIEARQTELPKPTISDMERKIVETFGVNPFKNSQVSKLFPDGAELEKAWRVLEDMRARGKAIPITLESGERSWHLVIK